MQINQDTHRLFIPEFKTPFGNIRLILHDTESVEIDADKLTLQLNKTWVFNACNVRLKPNEEKPDAWVVLREDTHQLYLLDDFGRVKDDGHLALSLPSYQRKLFLDGLAPLINEKLKDPVIANQLALISWHRAQAQCAQEIQDTLIRLKKLQEIQTHHTERIAFYTDALHKLSNT